MEKLVLIDGNAILHRAFHALPPLTNKKGEIVNAVYGFFSMFLKIVADFKPTYLVVCFDRPKPTFRQQLYAGYQAKRPKMSEDLVPQIKIVHEVLAKAKVSVFEIDGYEADDLIGTIAKQALVRGPAARSSRSMSSPPAGELRALNGTPSARVTPRYNIEVFIVSGDRDLLQLVNGQVKMIAPITGLTNMFIYDANKVEEKFGVKPAQIVDYKALVGDASDNYPGVAGVGPKTAKVLLQEYATLENTYKNLDKIALKNPNLAKKLAEGGESAGLAKKLATIATAAPIALDIQNCSFNHFDREGMKQIFTELGFKSLLKRLSQGSEKPKQKEQKKPAEKPQKEDTQMKLI